MSGQLDFKDSRSSEESKQNPVVPRSRGEKREAARTTVEASQCHQFRCNGFYFALAGDGE